MRLTLNFKLIASTSLALLFIGTWPSQIAAQPQTTGSAIITPRRIVLRRSPKLAREFPDRKVAVVRYPTVTGLSNPQAQKNVQSLLAVKNVFGSSLNDYRDDAWLEEFDYKVGYNKKNLLDITFSQSGTGAYPDTQFKHLLINLGTGKVVTAAEAFDNMSRKKLVQMANDKLQMEIRDLIKVVAGDKELDKEQRESLKGSLSELKFQEENLEDFEVNNNGLTFLFDAGFPHVIQSLQPDGRYFFTYSALKSYIKRDGPLAVLLGN